MKKIIAGTLAALSVGGLLALSPVQSFAEETSDQVQRFGMKMGRMHGGMTSTIGDLLGMDISELRQARSEGKSLAELAESKNVDVEKIVDTIKAERLDQINAMVEAGKMTEEQAEACKEDMETKITERINSSDFKKGRGMARQGNLIATISEVLDMDIDELKQARAEGKSFVEIAKEKNVDEQTLISTVEVKSIEQIDQLVADGKITSEQAERIKENLQTKLNTMLNNENIRPDKGQKGFNSKRGR